MSHGDARHGGQALPWLQRPGIQPNCLAAYRRSSWAKAKARVDASFETHYLHFAVTYPSVVVSCARAETIVKKAA
ncbi:MAG: hypothetical protein Udaeo2_29190 [Candidatus Udaeobacter sp.]|nr:MAG: hypothetical protein Udaeo2_29190 [Candidatus Udaeobacter sp.]